MLIRKIRKIQRQTIFSCCKSTFVYKFLHVKRNSSIFMHSRYKYLIHFYVISTYQISADHAVLSLSNWHFSIYIWYYSCVHCRNKFTFRDTRQIWQEISIHFQLYQSHSGICSWDPRFYRYYSITPSLVGLDCSLMQIKFAKLSFPHHILPVVDDSIISLQ